MIVEKNKRKNISNLLDEYCNGEWHEVLKMNRTVSKYPKGVQVFSEGQIANVVQIIEEGKVKVITDFEGKERLIRLASNGDIIGHRGFGGDNTYSVSAVTLTPVSLISIPKKIFSQILKANPEFCFEFLMFFAEELRISERQMKHLSNMPVIKRVAKAIRVNMESFGFDEQDQTKLSYTLSRKDIASFAVTTYESVIRSIGQLEKEGLVKVEGKSISILHKEALIALSI